MLVLAAPIGQTATRKDAELYCCLEKIYQLKFCRLIKVMESCYIEVILMHRKSLKNYSYNPTKNNVCSHLESGNTDQRTSKFENILVIGDLNVSMEDNNMKLFLQQPEKYGKSLIKHVIRTPKTRDIYLILTNKIRNFKNSCVIETSLSDFHKMTVTVS